MTQLATPRSARPAGPQPSASPPQKRMSLADVAKSAQRMPNRIILHGPPGIGKTELGSAFPSPIFAMTRGETGLLTLMQFGRVGETHHFPRELTTWQEVLDVIDLLASGEHEHRTFVLDSLNGAERLCHEHVCGRDYNGDFGERGFMGFQRGFQTSVGDWRAFLFGLDRLRERGMTILCLCHTGVGPIRNPMGPDYDSFQPALHKATWAVTVGWADMVLFAQKEVFVQSEKGKRAKGQSGRRVLLTEGTAAYEAKNRHGLPEEIDMGDSGAEAFANLAAAMKSAQAPKGGAA